MKKTAVCLNVIFIVLSLALDIALIITNIKVFKFTASVAFMIAATVNLIYVFKCVPSAKRPAVILTAGVFFAMSADIAIELNFIMGAALFAIGHICYIVSYSLMQRFHPTDLIPAAVLFVPCSLFMVLFPGFDYGGVAMEALCLIYAVIISVMAGKAVMNFIREKSRLSIILALGSVLFVISDIMLLMHGFSSIEAPFDELCVSIYYPAQCLLANAFLHAK